MPKTQIFIPSKHGQ